jgi:hypothetical protein
MGEGEGIFEGENGEGEGSFDF